MSLRSCLAVIGLFVLLFIVREMVLRKSFVDGLHLRMYDAAAGDLSLCVRDKDCLKYAQEIKSWVCAASVCEGTDKSKKPLDCWGARLSEYSKEVMDRMGPLMCPLIEFPSTETRRAILIRLPVKDVEGEDTLIEYGAYLLALKGSAESCEDYIKNYVGAYGSQWKYKWYKALSGCRIFARQSTREMEEKDFYTWFGVVQGRGSCSDMLSRELRKACNTPAAKFPVSVYDR
jgi:hypothetical protein